MIKLHRTLFIGTVLLCFVLPVKDEIPFCLQLRVGLTVGLPFIFHLMNVIFQQLKSMTGVIENLCGDLIPGAKTFDKINWIP